MDAQARVLAGVDVREHVDAGFRDVVRAVRGAEGVLVDGFFVVGVLVVSVRIVGVLVVGLGSVLHGGLDSLVVRKRLLG